MGTQALRSDEEKNALLQALQRSADDVPSEMERPRLRTRVGSEQVFDTAPVAPEEVRIEREQIASSFQESAHPPAVPDVTDETFQREVLDRSTVVPVVVHLWAEWCGPCRMLRPILERVVAEAGVKVELVNVDVDENPSIAGRFAVHSIPAVFAVAAGKVVESFVGARPETEVRDFVSRLVRGNSQTNRLTAPGGEAPLREALDL